MISLDDRRERTVGVALAGLFGLVSVLAGADLVTDLRQGTTAFHVLIEGTIAAFGLFGAAFMATRVHALAREARDLRLRTDALAADLDASRLEAERWRGEAKDLISGLGEAIDRQLVRWGLTQAEKEIALLLLKGLSHKEIAAIRDVGEATVRQQSRAIYRKAGLGGRHDLAAFFLEDLLSPGATDAPRGEQPRG